MQEKLSDNDISIGKLRILVGMVQSPKTMKNVVYPVFRHLLRLPNEMRLTKWGKSKKQYRKRTETVEWSFADAKQLHEHRYCGFRGVDKVTMQCLLAAACQYMNKMALVRAA